MTEADKQLDNDQDTVQFQPAQSEPSLEGASTNPDSIEEIEPSWAEEDLLVEAETVPSIGEPMSEINADVSQVSDGTAPEVEASDSPSSGMTDAQISELTQTIETLKAQVEERNSQYMRIAADFDNFRRRTLKEKEELEEKIKCTTISELLPVVDNFERARLQIKPQTDSEVNIHKSYQSVYKQLVECLKRVGVSPMRAEGKLFNPSFHEAVVREPTHEHEDGTVLEELVRGYQLGERVLRHALVKVAVAPEETSESQPEVDEA